jgi:hypothetical protein
MDFTTMTSHRGGKAPNRNLMNRCALAVAGGSSIGRWATENGVHPRTAYEWNRKRDFKELVAKFRRRYTDRAIGVMTKELTASIRELARLRDQSPIDTVRLNASRAILDELRQMSQHAANERRLAEIEAELKELRESRAIVRKATPSGPRRDPATEC